MIIGGMITSFLVLLGYMWKEAHSNWVRHVILSFPHFPDHWPPLTIFLFLIFIGGSFRHACLRK